MSTGLQQQPILHFNYHTKNMQICKNIINKVSGVLYKVQANAVQYNLCILITQPFPFAKHKTKLVAQ